MFNQSNAPHIFVESRDDPRSGFTIIEVVLVLAIAGLIFLMVFIALPALQRSQRDTQRREDLARLSTAITQYQTNNNNRLPSDDESVTCNKGATASDYCNVDHDDFVGNYLGGVEEFSDPLTNKGYSITFVDFADSSLNGHANNTFDESSDDGYRIMVYRSAECDGEHAVASKSYLDYAIVYNLEGSGTACIE